MKASLRRVRDRIDIQRFLPVHRTALRVPKGLVPPSPEAFASFGAQSWIVPPAAVIGAERISIGDRTTVLENGALCARPTGRIVIGNGVRLTRGVTIVAATSVTIEDNVSSSDGVAIVDCWDHDVAPAALPRPATSPPAPEPVVIEAGAYLGAGAIVLPGVTVGRGAFVGEGAVVTADVPRRTVVYGNPAAVVLTYDETASAWQAP